MGIFERMGRVASANFNALLDQAESPDKSLELTLREMQGHLRAARREVVRGVAAEKQLKHKVEEHQAELSLWVNRAELAVRQGKDDLARAALAQKRRIAAECERTEALRAQQMGEAMTMKAELERMERKLAEFTARKGTLSVLARQAAAGGGVTALGASAGGGSPVEAFQDMEERLDNVDAVFEAQREVEAALDHGRSPSGMSSAEVEAQFALLERGGDSSTPSQGAADGLDDELAQLKRKYRVEP